jgi:SAM-dependent methyltransferase
MNLTKATFEQIEKTRDVVRSGYGDIAQGKSNSCCGPSSCCSGDTDTNAEALSKAVGYSAEELAAIPDGANLGLSCGNPVALASLREGEVVVDLGAGAGFDVFQAGRKVGACGKAIGVDMTPAMLSRARSLVSKYRERSGLDNVEFRLGEIENLPIADGTVDAVISNCVINLSPLKARVYQEIGRILKSGGRLAVSDLALKKELPPEVLKMAEALVGCVSGAALIADNVHWAQEAGLLGIQVKEKVGYIDGMVQWEDPLYRAIIAALPQGSKLSDYIVSMELTANK